MAMTAIKELEKAVVREMWVNHGEPPAIVDETNKDRLGKETPKRKLTITDFRGMIPDPFHHDEASLESTEKLNRVRFKTIEDTTAQEQKPGTTKKLARKERIDPDVRIVPLRSASFDFSFDGCGVFDADGYSPL